MPTLTISHETWLEVSNLVDGTFAPLTGFLGKADFERVVQDIHLESGSPWPIPITLDIPENLRAEVESIQTLELENQAGEAVARVAVSEVYEVDLGSSVEKIFGTSDTSHPGVAKELARSPIRVAGTPSLLQPVSQFFPELAYSPEQTRALFQEKGWNTVVGFQTRNPPHRAHEYLHRVGMELCDGAFLQPLIGWKKPDDFSPRAVIAGYQVMVDEFYPAERAVLGTLATPMRYAGPREAIFHALIRRNHGCTHFIVGRDHAGVGGFYRKYEAQELCQSIDDLGIEILPLKGPYYCKKTGGIATEKTSRVPEDQQEQVSGTRMREMLAAGERPPEEFLRKEVADALIQLSERGELFVGDNV